MCIVDAMQINTLTWMNQVEDSLLLEMPNKDTSNQINEWMKLNPYKKCPGINELLQITFPYTIVFYLWCEGLQFNSNHCIYNIINLQRLIIKPHFIWVVYHTEFQFIFIWVP